MSKTPLLDRIPDLSRTVGGPLVALDPGPEQTALCVYHLGLIQRCAKLPNAEVLRFIRQRGAVSEWCGHTDPLAVEMVASYGMAVGREVFETCLWIGRFIEAWGGPYRLVYRLEVKLHLCKDSRAKDGNIRQALLDRFPGGKGTKARPGPLYGFSGSDMYSALSVAIVAAETPGEWRSE